MVFEKLPKNYFQMTDSMVLPWWPGHHGKIFMHAVY